MIDVVTPTTTILGVVALATKDGKHRMPALLFGAWAVHEGKDAGRWRITHAASGLQVRVHEPGGDEHGDVEWFEAVAIAEEMDRELGAADEALVARSKSRAHDAIFRGIGRATSVVLGTDILT